jgi:hypothetical protein
MFLAANAACESTSPSAVGRGQIHLRELLCTKHPIRRTGANQRRWRSRKGATYRSSAMLDDQIAAEADGITPRRQLVAWNHYEAPYFTLRVGFGLGYDYTAYADDADSKEQLDLNATDGLRDFRMLFKGQFAKRKGLSYTMGYM